MDIMQVLEDAGAVYTDRHFVYSSGKHGSGYINMDPLFTNVALVRSLGYGLSMPFWNKGYDVVAAPATGGIVLAYATAEQSVFGGALHPDVVWADKHGDGFIIERAGFSDRIRGKRVLVVEDLLTTGDSVAKTCREIERLDGEIVGVSAIVNRGGVTAQDLGVPRLESLAEVSFEAIHELECPHCDWRIPIVEDIGHGAEYKAANPHYPGDFIKLLS